MVTDQLAYAVKKGGQSIVSQVASAIAQSTSSVNFNVQIPSEQTIVDRRVFIKSTVLIQFQVTSAVNVQLPALSYGSNIALSAFPFHQLASTVQTTLNNNVTSINIKDVLPFLTRSNDSRELQKSMSSCPTLPDKFYFNSDDMGLSGVMGSFSYMQPNGTARDIALPANPGSVNGGFDTGGVDSDIIPNGSFSGPGANASAPNTGADLPVTLFYSTSNLPSGPWVAVDQTLLPNTPSFPLVGDGVGPSIRSNWYQLQFTTIEPVLCQPFLWSNPSSNTQGIYGLQTVQLQYNLTDPNRCFRLSDRLGVLGQLTVSNSQIVSVTNSQLIFKYLTPHPSDLLPARNVIPLMTYDRYFSNASNAVLSANYGTGQITSNTYNLTQVPDKICIFLRKKQTTQRPTDTDWSPVIQNISVNWNNNAGLLSSATLQDLYTYSVKAGSNQSFQEFCGQAYAYGSFQNPASSAGNYTELKSTVGSYLMLDFADVIQLTEDFYAPGSLGNFQLQFQLTVANQTGDAIPANTLEIVLVVCNSGIMVTDRGQTSTYTGILTKQDVLDASQTEALSSHDVKRIVGSGSMDSGRALPMKVCDMLRNARSLPAKAVEVAKEAVSKMANRLM